MEIALALTAMYNYQAEYRFCQLLSSFSAYCDPTVSDQESGFILDVEARRGETATPPKKAKYTFEAVCIDRSWGKAHPAASSSGT